MLVGSLVSSPVASLDWGQTYKGPAQLDQPPHLADPHSKCHSLHYGLCFIAPARIEKKKIKGTKCPLGFIMDFDVMICIIFVLKFETSPVLTKAIEKITRISRLFSSVLLDICYRNEERYFNFRWKPASEKITSSNRLITILFLCLIGINVVVYNWRFLIAMMRNWRCRRIVQF